MKITNEIIDMMSEGTQSWQAAAKDAYDFAFAYQCTVGLSFNGRAYLINNLTDYDLLLAIN